MMDKSLLIDLHINDLSLNDRSIYDLFHMSKNTESSVNQSAEF